MNATLMTRLLARGGLDSSASHGPYAAGKPLGNLIGMPQSVYAAVEPAPDLRRSDVSPTKGSGVLTAVNAENNYLLAATKVLQDYMATYRSREDRKGTSTRGVNLGSVDRWPLTDVFPVSPSGIRIVGFRDIVGMNNLHMAMKCEHLAFGGDIVGFFTTIAGGVLDMTLPDGTDLALRPIGGHYAVYFQVDRVVFFGEALDDVKLNLPGGESFVFRREEITITDCNDGTLKVAGWPKVSIEHRGKVAVTIHRDTGHVEGYPNLNLLLGKDSPSLSQE